LICFEGRVIIFIRMEKEKLQILEEVKQAERELYLKRSKLASLEAMEYNDSVSKLIKPSEEKDLKKIFSNLIKIIGEHSSGGDGVKDIRQQRTE